MTFVTIECAQCTAISVAEVGEVLLEVGGRATHEQLHASVSWICAGCSTLVHRPIDWRDFVALVTAGAAIVDEEEDDLRPPSPEAVPSGPAWTRDDLLDLHLLLITPDWFAELEATTITSAGPR
jgi:hypothetical protein